MKIGTRKISNLYFADDIAVIADNKKDLEVLLDAISQFALKWRITFNYEKCNIVVFDNKPDLPDSVFCEMKDNGCTCSYHYKFGSKYIKEASIYKYLGIELDKRLSLKAFKQRLLAKARRNANRVWYMGRGKLSVKSFVNMYEALVRSQLEYGTDVWGFIRWDEAEKIQFNAARKILHASKTTCRQALIGELGWYTLESRRDITFIGTTS